MAKHWLLSAVTVLAVTAGPVFAEDKASTTPKPAAPEMLLAQAAPAAAAPGEKKPDPPAPPKFTYGGSADFYFLSNFNNPWTGTNALRAFDYKDERGPHLGLIDIWAAYARDPIGGRIDVDFGPTSYLVNAFDPSRDELWQHIQQLYISANLDKKGTNYIDIGKWVTTAGAEVIEPKDNWLYSRGLLFNVAEPFYHLGVRGYHTFEGGDNVGVAIHRGWNAVGNPHHDPGFAIFGTKAINKQLTFTGNYYGGEESPVATEGKAWRNFLDLVLLYNPDKSKFAYTFNLDYVQQSSSTLWGVSAQAKYTLNPKSYLAARGEFLLDDGLAGTGDIYSVTLGYAYQFNQYFQTRAEFRDDFGSNDLFAARKNGTFKDNQPTFLISAIFNYH